MPAGCFRKKKMSRIPAGFSDSIAGRERIGRLRSLAPQADHAAVERQLAASADVEGALRLLVELATQQPAILERFSRRPAELQNLITLFSYSRFLGQELIRSPEWTETALSSKSIQRSDSIARLRKSLFSLTNPIPIEGLGHVLAKFRRREYVRILLRDCEGIATIADTTRDLSHLADAILEVAYRRVRRELVRKHGEPSAAPESEQRHGGMTVIALGKLGGEELNYSSDVDLMFVYEGNGETAGPGSISNKEFFKKLVNTYTQLLSAYTSEGLCYRVDLRLRPEGRLGEAAISLDGARQYYRHRARDWELQMLIKARAVAGELGAGQELLRFVEPLTYSTTLDFGAVERVSEARLRIHEKAAAGRRGAIDVKLMPGGIRDIEFLVQCLQRLHGGREPWVRHAGTLLALARLRDKGLLSAGEHASLASAYEFLRHLEHRLQLVDDRQTHVLPSDEAELEILAKRMPAPVPGSVFTTHRLLETLHLHAQRVGQLYERVIHAQKISYYSALIEPEDLQPEIYPAPEPHPRTSNLVRFLERLTPGFGALLAESPLKVNDAAFERFLEKLQARPDLLRFVDENPAIARRVLDIFGHSNWLSEMLTRNPALLAALENPEQPFSRPLFASAHGLRQEYQEQLFRVVSRSLCDSRPVFETLVETSQLADAAIARAYRSAIEQAGGAGSSGMMIISLGRLGTQEFDVASDADLIFVIPDEEDANLKFWTGVAERTVDILSAYTGDGTLFAVDMRLRPGGRDGALVQTESAYQKYFETRAEAWEGIAYMKARAVVGPAEETTRFLHDLQRVDWQTYGQSGRSRLELANMRRRLEKEQGRSNPLKAGPGGYYDIDFALLYLRLRGAGTFFRVLNTPDRISVVEKMGYLSAADASFLRSAATFYRAIDHGIRLQTGHSGGRLPTSPARLEQLTSMVRRWSPSHLKDKPLVEALGEIQHKTREYFNRLFSPEAKIDDQES